MNYMKKKWIIAVSVVLVLALAGGGIYAYVHRPLPSMEQQLLECEHKDEAYENIVIKKQTDFGDARIVLYAGVKDGVEDESFGTAVFYKGLFGRYRPDSWGSKGKGFRFGDFSAKAGAGNDCYYFCGENADGRVAKLRVELMTGGELSFDVPSNYYILIASPEQNNGAAIFPKAEYFYAADGTLVTENY